MKNTLEVNSLGLSYGQSIILFNCSFVIEEGEIIHLRGKSGVGKTSLMKALAGLVPITSGSIYWHQEAWADGWQRLPAQQRKIGFVFQDYALFPHLNAVQNIAFALRGWKGVKKRNRIAECLEMLQISELSHRYPRQMSGGQQQRLAIARALAAQPSLLLLDEPLVHLEPELRWRLEEELSRLFADEQVTAIISSHQDVNMVNKRELILKQGRCFWLNYSHTESWPLQKDSCATRMSDCSPSEEWRSPRVPAMFNNSGL